MTLIHGLYCLSAHLLTQLPKTTNQPSKPEIIGGSAKPSSNTFYDVTLSRNESMYDTNPGRARNTEPVVFFGGVGFDEAPFGFFAQNANGIGSGMRMGVGMSNSRDSSSVATYSGRVDITSQIDRYNQVKAGIELVSASHNVNYARIDSALPTGNVISRWENNPLRGGGIPAKPI